MKITTGDEHLNWSCNLIAKQARLETAVYEADEGVKDKILELYFANLIHSSRRGYTKFVASQLYQIEEALDERYKEEC